MCYDMTSTNQTLSTSVASINTRNINYSPDHRTVYPKIDFPEEFRIDTKPFVNRPFFVESITWTTAPRFTMLNSNTYNLPRDVFLSNPSLENALKLGAFFRSDLSLNISIAGTITHAGTLLIGILPPMPYKSWDTNLNKYMINTMMSGPHCFLHANEATSAVLHVPWYCNTDVASLDMRNVAPETSTAFHETIGPGNFATLAIMVLSPLSVSTGSSTSLSLNIEACFSSLDIFVPSPKYLLYTQGLQSIATAAIDATTSYTKTMVGDAIDVLRAGIKYYTGLHNPNVPLISNRMIVAKRNYPNNTTGEQFFEKLDPYPEIDRIVDRPIFNTEVDEMSIKHIISKPQYIGTFRANALDPVGQLLWSRPISPNQGGLDQGTRQIANNIELIHYLSRAWRGSINIHIQSVMNNKQQIKLRLIQLYSPPTKVALSFPTYQTLASAPSHLMEFSGGGQIHTINIPYLCRNQLTPCAPDLALESLFHGMYYIFVAQSLANSADSPVDVNFNVFISAGEDLTFHGYATETGTLIPLLPPGGPRFVTQGMNVMNEPQDSTPLQDYSTSINLDQSHQERLHSPVDVRPIIRRMYHSFTTNLTAGPNVFDLEHFIGEQNFSNYMDPSLPAGTLVNLSPMQMIANMYYGKSVGLKIKIKAYSDSQLSIMYAPQQIYGDVTTAMTLNCKVKPRPEYSPSTVGPVTYPVPFLEMAQEQHGNQRLYEFVVPNTSIYKFIGGPEKFGSHPVEASAAQCGTLIVWTDAPVKVSFFIGMTDESRLGFHVIAPHIRPAMILGTNSLATMYLGAVGGDDTTPPLAQLNDKLYFSR